MKARRRDGSAPARAALTGPGAQLLPAIYRGVLLAAGLVVAGLLFRQLVTLLVGLLVTVIIAIPAEGIASRLERIRVPRPLGAFAGLGAMAAGFAAAFALVIPPVVEEGAAFLEDLPAITDAAVERVADLTGLRPERVGNELQAFVQSYLDNPSRIVGPLASVSLSVLSALAAAVFALITAYYVALRPRPLVDAVLRLFAPPRRDRAEYVMRRLRSAWIGWLQGVAVDMVVSGILLYVGLRLADVRFAMLFAVFSAVLVVVPYFGAVAGGIPPVLFALADSPQKALLVLGIYVLVQQVEGNLIIPLVMARTVKLHPAAIAVGVVVVAQLLGIVGLVVAVPIIAAAVILTEELWVKPREAPPDPGIVLTGEADGDEDDTGVEDERRASGPDDEGDALDWDRRRFLLLLGLPSMALALAITMVTTYLPVLIEEKAGPAVTGLLIGTEGLLALFVPLLVGARSDKTRTRFGSRTPYLLAATPLAVVALVLMPLVGSLLALVILLLAFYAAYFTYYAPYYALYPDVVPAEERGRSQGFQNTLREVGLGGALVGGGVLLGLWQPLPFLVAGLVLTAVTLAFAWRVEEPSPASRAPDDRGAYRRARALVAENPGLRWAAVAVALWELALAALKTFVVLFFTVGLGRSIGFASVVLAVVAVTVVVAAIAGGKLADRIGTARLIGVAVWVYAAGLVVPAFWNGPPALMVVPIAGLAAGVVMTLSYALVMGLMPEDAHGAGSGLYGFARGAGVLLGPPAAGLAIHFGRPLFESTNGYAAMFLVAAAAVFASIPALHVARRRATPGAT